MPRYRIHVEALGTPEPDTLTFEADNHDDILRIARRAQNRPGLTPDEAAALAIGMKLFGEVLLKHRKTSPFAELQPHFRDFVGAFKAANAAANPTSAADSST